MKKYRTRDFFTYFQRYTRYLLICLTLASIGAGFQVGLSVAIFNTPTQVKENKKNHLMLTIRDKLEYYFFKGHKVILCRCFAFKFWF